MYGRRVFACLFSLLLLMPVARAAGDAARGAQAFRICAACHSVVPDRNMTGPSLAHVWGRKAGSLASFDRYSPALQRSGVVWDTASLDAWIKNPAAFIPYNAMTFPGLQDAATRADLIAYLKALGEGKTLPPTAQGGMGGMMGSTPQRPDLKQLKAEDTVTSIRYCRDTYYVTTADGKTRAFWESNLRFKTDSSDLGPHPGAPVMLGAGMAGDRAFVIFAKPEEFDAFVRRHC